MPWRKTLSVVLFVMALAISSAATYIHVHQHQLRKRAERLLADFRNLQLHRGTIADAQQIAGTWDKTGAVDTGCDMQTCRFDISVGDQVWLPRNVLGRAVIPLYWMVGWHSAAARGTIETRNGIIDRTEFVLMLDVPPYVSKVDREGYGLFGHATQQPEFEAYQFWPQRNLHPDYVIGKPGGCEGCIKLMTFFLPTAPPAKIEELTDFDLSCITRWVPCTTEADIMPSAWKQYEAESGVRVK